MRPFAEFIAAATLLTRLPVARMNAGIWPAERDAVWAYPLIGAMVGVAGGTVMLLGARAGLPPVVAALLSVSATLLLTGGLHEDGLADTADGLGGGCTVAEKLEIMRDSRIGVYGALALIVALGLRVAALAEIPPASIMPALAAAGGLGRGAIAGLLLLLRPARPDGVAAGLWPVGGLACACTIGLAAASVAWLPPRLALAAMLGAVCATLALAAAARAQVGGFTGDVLGAGVVVTECAVLCVVSAGV